MAYLIAGHGAEVFQQTFEVPPGCTIVVHTRPYELSYTFTENVNRLVDLPPRFLTNPVQYASEIIKAIGSVAIYQAGEQCPQFKYMTINCISYPNSPYDTCYGYSGSGINDMTKMHYEPKNSYLNIPLQEIVFDRDLSSLDPGNVKQLVSQLYRYSIYPTMKEVKQFMRDNHDTFLADSTEYSENGGEIISEINSVAMMQSILKNLSQWDVINPTQEFLCHRTPGVYYNLVCRYSEGVNNINEYNESLQKSQIRISSARHLSRDLSNVPNNMEEKRVKMVEARIAEAETKRKGLIRNMVMDPLHPSYRNNRNRKGTYKNVLYRGKPRWVKIGGTRKR